MESIIEIKRYFAMRDIDFAVDYLTEVLNKSPRDNARQLFSSTRLSQNDERILYAGELDLATRRLWRNAWRYEIGIERAHEELVPLLERAVSRIEWAGKHFEDIKGLIRGRIKNLEEKYCCGIFLKKRKTARIAV